MHLNYLRGPFNSSKSQWERERPASPSAFALLSNKRTRKVPSLAGSILSAEMGPAQPVRSNILNLTFLPTPADRGRMRK